MSSILEKSLEYFEAFNRHDLDELREMFSEDVSLRDWEISVSGIDEVLGANSRIFGSVDSISITPIMVYEGEDKLLMGPLDVAGTSIIELEILINGKEKLLVTDILDFNRDGKIKSIRAYIGNKKIYDV
tara:strand:+ start:215 stop:601 length:387 start_codon:yes stop_codon:yes gene_type:complete